MNDLTCLEPLQVARARQLLDLMQQTSKDDGSALALDETGRVTGLVAASDACEEHLLGDLDVHA
jgi:hypothetical protein